ncbi:hypothetical protein ACFOVU_16515 [Nocardiopsis sediminis]|uniref:Regulatory protein RecX n=1 Tax=Nocardiopsis sediminis TaxID=1778267 RepID=A0ABV8FQF4_9ACTN
MDACEELVAALDSGRVTDAQAYLALKPLWRQERLTRPPGRPRQHFLRAREELKAAVLAGVLSQDEAQATLRLPAQGEPEDVESAPAPAARTATPPTTSGTAARGIHRERG